jgi:cell wall-associated NlpC family hydrolase
MCSARLLRTSLVLVAASLAGACATGGAVPRPFPTPGAARTRPPGAQPTSATAESYALVGTALGLRGTPYRDGGADPNGFDCSGFTQYVFAQYGMTLPRQVRDQFEQGNSVKAGELAAGDLLFFTTVAPGPTHVGIAIGGDQFVHAPSSTGVVRVERLGTSYWATRYLGARRVM